MNNKEKMPERMYYNLVKQYGDNLSEEILNGLTIRKKVTLRVNTLKSNINEIKQILDINNIKYCIVDFFENALIIENTSKEVIEKLNIYEQGKIYLQSLSSMLPVLVLNPKEKKDILDMTAAPGSKTTQIAALTNNKALITAIEMNSFRCEKLKYNLNKQGAKANVMQIDARKLDDFFSFDQILLDAPCSGSGTLELYNESNKYQFTEKFEEKLEKTQTSLIMKAMKILKKDEEMVYSTCSILYRENENIINKIINANLAKIVEIDEKLFDKVPKLPCKIKGGIVIKPTELYEGFFITKLRKN